MGRVKNLLVSIAVLLAVAVGFATTSRADALQVVVVPSFLVPAKEIAAAFTAKTGSPVVLTAVTTGESYSQINQGLPFEVWLSADAAHPATAVREGNAVADSAFTYAIGKLYMWSKNEKLVTGASSLESDAVHHIAISNPVNAPFGAAAIEALHNMGVWDHVSDRIVRVADIVQAYQFAANGNVEIAFIANSQIVGHPEGSLWEVPQEFYTPVRQEAVLLKKGENDRNAVAFLAFLRGPEAAKIIEKYGYDLK